MKTHAGTSLAARLVAVGSVSCACQQLTGLDDDRTLDVPACSEGERRCGAPGIEECGSDRRWAPIGACERCVAGECLERPPHWIAAGHEHTCAIWNGRVACWGASDQFQTGVGPATACPQGCTGEKCIVDCTAAPRWIEGFDGATAVSGLGDHTCALADGDVFCWGEGKFGQLGRAKYDASGVPLAAQRIGSAGERAIEIGAGGGDLSGIVQAGHTCALGEAGTLYCWGANCASQLGSVAYCAAFAELATCDPGTDARATVNIPAEVAALPSDEHLVQITTGGADTCALTEGGDLYCWGWNAFGQINGATQTMLGDCVTQPTRLSDVPRLLQVSAGGSATCAVSTDRRVLCWGRNDKLTLGAADKSTRGPIEVESLSNVIEVSVGHGSTACALTSAGEVWCWGENENAEAGSIDNSSQNPADGEVGDSPTRARKVLLDGTALTVSSGGNHTCAFVQGAGSDPELYCWGQRSRGAVGDGSTGNPTEPVRIDPPP